MQMTRRTQADRSAATRGALLEAGRALFGEHGFAGVGTEAIVRRAGVSRGALYHQFADKTELFAAVFDDLEQDLSQRLAENVLASGESDVLAVLGLAIESWLDVCEEPAVRQIVLLDGPSVLGWARWREIMQPYALGLVQGLLDQAVATGDLPPYPVRPLAHLLVAMADEAALYVMAATDPAAARAEIVGLVGPLLAALRNPPGTGPN